MRTPVVLFTRRGVLFSACGVAFGAEERASERVRFLDPATEFELLRLTGPDHASLLPPRHNRIFARRGAQLIFASDAGGSLSPWALDIKSGKSRQITTASALDVSSLCLTVDERNLCYLDGGALKIVAVGGGSGREVAKLEGFEPGRGIDVLATGAALVVEERTKLRMVNLLRGMPVTVAENPDGVWFPMGRPKRASVLYRSGDNYWLAHLDGQRNVRLKTPEGGIGPAQWAPDGRSFYYLHFPVKGQKSSVLREHAPDSGEDKLAAPTSQYAQFGLNSDGSVLVGASASLAGQYVLLMLRASRRELALAEHKASDPAFVNPMFSPDSQRIYFQSDRHGKPAIYSMAVEKLVERTGEEEPPPPAAPKGVPRRS